MHEKSQLNLAALQDEIFAEEDLMPINTAPANSNAPDLSKLDQALDRAIGEIVTGTDTTSTENDDDTPEGGSLIVNAVSILDAPDEATQTDNIKVTTDKSDWMPLKSDDNPLSDLHDKE